MNPLLKTILDFLKHALVQKFAADIAKNLLNMLIDVVEGMIRQRQIGLAAA